MKWKCVTCGKKVDENNSIGRDCLLMCNKCVTTIGEKLNIRDSMVFRVVLQMGFLKEENEKGATK